MKTVKRGVVKKIFQYFILKHNDIMFSLLLAVGGIHISPFITLFHFMCGWVYIVCRNCALYLLMTVNSFVMLNGKLKKWKSNIILIVYLSLAVFSHNYSLMHIFLLGFERWFYHHALFLLQFLKAKLFSV